MTRQFTSFVLIGGFAALVNWLVRFPIERAIGFEAAIVVSYLVAMTTAFLLNRAYVFPATARDWREQYVRFGLVNLIALAQVFVVSVALARGLFPAIGFAWHAEAVAHAVGLASPVLTSYWGHKRFSFAPVAATAALDGERTPPQ